MTTTVYTIAAENPRLLETLQRTAEERERLRAINAELLEALETVLHHQVYGTSTSYPLALNKARAVIARAKGKP